MRRKGRSKKAKEDESSGEKQRRRRRKNLNKQTAKSDKMIKINRVRLRQADVVDRSVSWSIDCMCVVVVARERRVECMTLLDNKQ